LAQIILFLKKSKISKIKILKKKLLLLLNKMKNVVKYYGVLKMEASKLIKYLAKYV
jgi:hypothetical protein